jgi:hypothetical protein
LYFFTKDTTLEYDKPKNNILFFKNNKLLYTFPDNYTHIKQIKFSKNKKHYAIEASEQKEIPGQNEVAKNNKKYEIVYYILHNNKRYDLDTNYKQNQDNLQITVGDNGDIVYSYKNKIYKN